MADKKISRKPKPFTDDEIVTHAQTGRKPQRFLDRAERAKNTTERMRHGQSTDSNQ